MKDSGNSKIYELIGTAKKYWNAAPKGKYVSYKEMLNLGMAGFGVHWASVLTTTIGLDASNFLVGASIQIRPMHLYVMLLIANLVGIPIAFFRGWFIDNHKFPGGKFVPLLMRTPIPFAFLSTFFVWLPFENWQYSTKVIVVWCMYMCITFLYAFFGDSWVLLQQVISPDAQERVQVMSITQIIYSLAPTLSNLIIPTIAGLTFGLNNLMTYRIIYPAFTIVGLIVLFAFMPKVKERIVLPKRKMEYFNIFDSLREVCKNKYFWIINSSGWVGFLEGAYHALLGWSFLYAYGGEKQEYLGIANTIIGNAALWSFMVVPFIIRAIGKRNLLITHNILNIVLMLCLLPCYESLIAIVAIFYLNSFINTFGNVYFMAIQADMRDYHQWKTGVRLDGLFGPLTTIGTVIGFGTGFVTPSIYEYMGLKNDYNVLYDDMMRNNLFQVLIFCSIIGAILNLIPFLFYDLTEAKHKGYVDVLKIRALFADYGNNELDDDVLMDAMAVIIKARELRNSEKTPIDKSGLRAARKMPKETANQTEARNEELKKQKELVAAQRERNLTIESLPIVIAELEKFSTERYQKQLSVARETVYLGKDGFYANWQELLSRARTMPKSTKEEKQQRNDLISIAKQKRRSEKLLKKLGQQGMQEENDALKKEIQNGDSDTILDRINTYRKLKSYTKKVSSYKRFMQPYNDAKALVFQSENYTQLSKIEELYNAKINA